MSGVFYEWSVELVTAVESAEHEENEVLDIHHFDSFREAAIHAATPPDDGCRWDVVLVRDDANGRSWAYLEDGKLPAHFEDAYQNAVANVPRRFHKEVARG